MERSNQPPKPECCLQPGQEPESQGKTAPNDLWEAYTRQTRGPHAGFASCLINSASKCLAADGDGVGMPEPNMDRAVAGEALEGLPGSKSVARAAEAARNQRDPEGSRRTNYEGQAGNREARPRAAACKFGCCRTFWHGFAGSKNPAVNSEPPQRIARAEKVVGRHHSWLPFQFSPDKRRSALSHCHPAVDRKSTRLN